MTTLSTNDSDWLARFHGPNRDYRWESSLESLLDAVPDPNLPVFVPRRENEGTLSWYALAHTPREGRELRELLLGFLGPNYSDFTGQTAVLDSQTPHEALLQERFAVAYRLRIVRAEDEDHALQQLLLLRRLLRERPPSPVVGQRTLQQYLRDFELWLRDGQFDAAWRLVEELRERGQLATIDLSALRVRLLAGQRRWEDLLALPELPSLLLARLPARVSEALASAVYHRLLAPSQEANAPEQAVALCRERVLPRYGNVLRASATWREPSALKTALIAELASPVPSEQTLKRIRHAYPSDAPDIAYVDTLLALADPPPPPVEPVDPLDAIHDALDRSEWPEALQLALAQSSSVATLRLAIDAAVEVGTPESAQQVVSALADCEASLRERVLARRSTQTLWAELETTATSDAEDVPASWLGWLERVCQSHWPSAVQVAEQGAREWTTAEFRDDPAQLANFVEQLEQASSEHAAAALRDSFPFLLEAFLPADRVEPRWKPIYRQLLESSVLDASLSPAATSAIRELAGALLHSNLSATSERNEYADLVDYLSTAWEQLKRPALLEWGLELLDLLAEHAVHRSADVTPLLQSILAEFSRVRSRSSFGQRAMLEIVTEELEQQSLFEMAQTSEPETPETRDEEEAFRERLSGRTVALLTLADRIASVFTNALRKRFPKTRVTILQEKDGSKRLRDVAKSADVFIVNTYDVPHAATGYVPQHRPEEAVTLYPEGKNAARQIEALERWLRES